jgi:hypothetical protein
MITQIRTIDKEQRSHEFIVSEEAYSHSDIEGILYKISKPELPTWKHFEFVILFVTNRILIYRINNNDHPELSGKGIVKSMIKAISDEFNKDIVSSTNKAYKLDDTEGRIPSVTKYWKRWLSELENVEYLEAEDRYVFKPVIKD